PPIILLGIPNPMLDHILHRLKINQRCFDSKIPLFIFAVLFFIYHLPFILNLLSQHSFFQNGYLILLFILSFGMWWPIASPDPSRRLHQEHMKRYAFLSGLILMPACMLFILTALLDG